MFTVDSLRPTFYLRHSLYNTKHFHVMHIGTLNISVLPVADFFWCNIIHLFIAKMLNKRPAIVFSESGCVFWQCLSESSLHIYKEHSHM